MQRNFIIILIGISTLFAGCRMNSDEKGRVDSTFVFSHEPANAVYHWKTVLSLNDYEKGFMQKHQVKRMYVKFFDVGVDNLYDENGMQAVPIATTIFRLDSAFINANSIDVVPVVFITVEALRLDTLLGTRVVKRVDDMCRANHIQYNEMQLDCDWTKETKALFYNLCLEVKGQLHQKQKGLSATIRLHQLRDSLPDIDYGVLMLYNTESLKDPKVKNSILSSQAVKAYMRNAKSDKHLDFAYPTYEWTLWFKDSKFMGILHEGDSLNVDGELRHESSDFHEIMATKGLLKSELKDIAYPSSNIIYHLDSANLSKYSDHEIDQIYSR